MYKGSKKQQARERNKVLVQAGVLAVLVAAVVVVGFIQYARWVSIVSV